ncbi:MAG: peptide chain release factor N(5)-glutamine methyltransferase, partial [Chloroflexota bacterium]|nr:peptide chain release factor N(5)-glutamine methyltransferase [Chloroflexota bacterium]
MNSARSIETGTAVGQATRRLRDAGSPSPRLDAELLAAHVAGRDRAWVLAHPEAEVDATQLEALVGRRAAGEPIAYIRGFKEWHSLRIRTDARALIPRPETELLADAAADEIDRRLASGSVVAWEVATGSGAVAVFLALRFARAIAGAQLRLIATDISPDALALAAENLAGHDVADAVALRAADLLAPAGAELPRP